MRNRPSTLVIALVAVLSLLATGCGDDDGGGNAAVNDENRPYVDAMKASMQASNAEDEDSLQLTDDQIDCMAPRWVNTIGVDRLEENDVTPEMLEADTDMEFSDLGLGEEEGNALYDAFDDCGVNLGEAMMEQMAADEEMSDEAKACMEGVFTDDNLRKLMVSSLVNGDEGMEDDPELAPLMGQLMGCAFMSMGDMETGDSGS